MKNKTGYCVCGCGRVTSICKLTRRGYKKGEHVLYIRGHQFGLIPEKDKKKRKIIIQKRYLEKLRKLGKLSEYRRKNHGDRGLQTAKWVNKSNNRLKKRAHQMVFREIKKGKLLKEPCEVCKKSNTRIEAHHEDYSKPLDVRWLCTLHHVKIHRGELTLT